MRELAEIVRDTVPGCELEFAGDASPDTRNYRVDCSKIARALPNLLRSGRRARGCSAYKAYSDSGISLEEIEGYRYRRLARSSVASSGDLDGLRARPRKSSAGTRPTMIGAVSEILSGPCRSFSILLRRRK